MPLITVPIPECTTSGHAAGGLNINHPASLACLGFLGPISEGHRFALTVRQWHEDVLRWPGRNGLIDGDVVHFRARNRQHDGRPVLILGDCGIAVTCNPGPAPILAELCGIDYEAERVT